MQKRVVFGLGAIVILAGYAAVSHAEEAPVTYTKNIEPLFDKRCLKCHGSDAPLVADFKKNKEKFTDEEIGPRMDTYENVLTFINGSDAGAMMRRLDDGKNTQDGKPGNMYKKLGADDAARAANLELIKKWIGTWNLKRRADWTPAELAAVKAPKD